MIFAMTPEVINQFQSKDRNNSGRSWRNSRLEETAKKEGRCDQISDSPTPYSRCLSAYQSEIMSSHVINYSSARLNIVIYK